MPIMLCQSDKDSVMVDSGRDSELNTLSSAITEIDSVRLISAARQYDLKLLTYIHDACTKLPLNEDLMVSLPNVLHLPDDLPDLEGFIRLRSCRARYFAYRAGRFESYIPDGLTIVGEGAEWFVAYLASGDTPSEAFAKVLFYHPECLSGHEYL